MQMDDVFGEVVQSMPVQLVEPVERMINRDVRYRPTMQYFMAVSDCPVCLPLSVSPPVCLPLSTLQHDPQKPDPHPAHKCGFKTHIETEVR